MWCVAESVLKKRIIEKLMWRLEKWWKLRKDSRCIVFCPVVLYSDFSYRVMSFGICSSIAHNVTYIHMCIMCIPRNFTHIHTHPRTPTHTHTHTHMHTYRHTYTHVYTLHIRYIHTRIHVTLHTYTHINIPCTRTQIDPPHTNVDPHICTHTHTLIF